MKVLKPFRLSPCPPFSCLRRQTDLVVEHALPGHGRLEVVADEGGVVGEGHWLGPVQDHVKGFVWVHFCPQLPGSLVGLLQRLRKNEEKDGDVIN